MNSLRLLYLASWLTAIVSSSFAQQSPYKPYIDYLPQGVALQSTVAEVQAKFAKTISIPQTPGRPNEQEFADPTIRAKPIEVIVYRFVDGKLVAINFEGEVPNGSTLAAVLTQIRGVVLNGFTKIRDENVEILNEWRKEPAVVEVFERSGSQESAYLVAVGQAVRLVVFDRTKAQLRDFFPDVSAMTEQELQKFRGVIAPPGP